MAKSLLQRTYDDVRRVCPGRNNKEINAAMTLAHEELHDKYVDRIIEILGVEDEEAEKIRKSDYDGDMREV